MMRRSVRVLVLLVTVAVTAGVVWRATANEQVRGRMRLGAQQTDAVAADAIFELSDLRSSLHAYVAPGQGVDFWSGRARAQMASIRARLNELQPAALAANYPLEPATASLDALATTERRIRTAVGDAQPLVAGDIIFTEARDLIDSLARHLSDARQAMARVSSSREAGAANEQSLLAGALIAVWIFAIILLVPVPATRGPVLPRPLATEEPADLRLRPAEPEPAVVPHAAPALVEEEAVVAPAAPLEEAVPVSPAPVTIVSDTPVFQSLAAICVEIGRVADASELPPLLERAASLIGARGLVVWLTSPAGGHLVPAMAHGYDEKLLARMGPIPVDDHNVTAAAFRTHEPARVPADGVTPGAVAIPLLSASGASGVLAAEVPAGTELDRAAALLAILAAQLASLFPAPVTEEVGS